VLPSREIRYALGAICLWATQALILAKELPHLNILVFLTLSFVFSGIFLSIRIAPSIARFFPLFRKRSSRLGWKKFKKILAKPYFVAGVAGYFLYHFLLFHALDKGPVVTANLLNFLWPLFYVIMAEIYFPQEHRNGNEGFYLYTKIALGLIGCVLLITRGGGLEITRDILLGPILGLLAAVTWAAFTIVVKLQQRVTQEIQPRVWWAFYPFGAALISFIILLVFEDKEIIYDLKNWRNALIPALYFGAGPLGLAMLFYDKAVKLTQAQKLGRLTLLTPLLSTALLFCFSESEPINFWAGLGGFLVIIANMRLRAKKDAVVHLAEKYRSWNDSHRNGWDRNWLHRSLPSYLLNNNLPVNSLNDSQNGLLSYSNSNLISVHIKIENAIDFELARKGRRLPQDIRCMEFNVLVDKNTSIFGLNKSAISELGLSKVGNCRVKTTNGRVKHNLYGKVRLTVLDQTCTVDFLESAEDASTLLGYLPLENINIISEANGNSGSSPRD
jgi:drug/metabolite transporter (DMT)-like permease